MYCNINKYAPLRGATYIDLPEYFKNKKCIINVQNKDNRCFAFVSFVAFTSEEKLKEHNVDFRNCSTNNQPAKLILPKKNDAFIQFKNHNNKFRCPFVIYADFESLLQENTTGEQLEIKHVHSACIYMFKVVSAFDEYTFEPKIFRGKDAIKNFLQEILKQKMKL